MPAIATTMMPSATCLRRALVWAVLGAAPFVSPASSQTTVNLDYELIIQPIALVNSSHQTAVWDHYSSEISLFQAATQQILAQAGIRVVWANWNYYTDSTNAYWGITGSPSQLASLTQTAGHGQSASTTYSQNAQPGDVLNLWFSGPAVNNNGTVLGFSNASNNTGVVNVLDPVFANGGTVSETIFNSGSPYYSLTTIAHELGRILGLTQYAINAGPTYTSNGAIPITNVMYGESNAYLATTIDQLYNPDSNSTGYGQLTVNQIAMLHLNPLLHTNPVANDTYTYSAVPEPSTFALLAGLMVCGFVVWKRRRS